MVEYLIITAAFSAALVPIAVLLHVWILPALVARQLTNVRTLAEQRPDGAGQPFHRHPHRDEESFRVLLHVQSQLSHCPSPFPGVPWYNLPRLHRLLAGEMACAGSPVCRSYTRFLLHLARFASRAWRAGGRALPPSLS